MNEPERTFNLDELCALTDQSKRTVRFYIQIGMLAKPTGLGRGAHYTTRHLEQLLEIRKWQNAGLSLERIQELLIQKENPGLLPPLPPRKPGSLEVWSHLVIAEGVELMIEPQRAQLTPEQVRQLARAVIDAFKQIPNNREHGDE